VTDTRFRLLADDEVSVSSDVVEQSRERGMA
jgi:hypothetical protein